MKFENTIRGATGYALAFGLFLGLCIWKFGNPVILDGVIPRPVSLSDWLNDPWPTRWANWILLPLSVVGLVLAAKAKSAWQTSCWLWMLPLGWFGWQLISAAKTVDFGLTVATLWQFFGCITCYFLGAFVLRGERPLRWLLIGVLAAFTFCLMRAVEQRLIEFPQTHQSLIEGQKSAWTNYPPEQILEMKREKVIISTNGLEVANPAILAKFAKGRVNGTMVYPNALAGLILLLFPISAVLAFGGACRLRPAIRGMLIALTLFLGVAGFVWTGSKLGWLIAVVVGGVCLFRLKWAARIKWLVFLAVMLLGLGVFAVRFHNYFAAGATSASARVDYWRAAGQTLVQHPFFGTGPGTFQRPYARLKAPEAEMARLTHNDYLEQFSDSGIPGGVFYAAWIFVGLLIGGRRVLRSNRTVHFAIFVGLLGWFVQGIGEFSLYVPGLAWTVFTLLGCLLGTSGNQIDKSASAN